MRCAWAGPILDVGGLESPDQSLDPKYHSQEAIPAYEGHRIGNQVLAGDRDFARKPQDKDKLPSARSGNDEKSCECRVTPEVKLKAEQRFNDFFMILFPYVQLS
jgi:hypothetical protein